VSCGTQWDTLLGVHALLEIGPPLPGDLDLSLRQLGGVVAEHVKQDEEVRRAPVENPVKLAPVVTAKLAQLPFDLRGVRERQVRVRRREQVETIDLLTRGRLLRGASKHCRTLGSPVFQ
jgi:hypothetical protein